MKTTYVVLLALCACGVKPQVSEAVRAEAQQAIAEVARAIVMQDLAAFKARYMPERYRELGSTDEARDVEVLRFMDGQRVGLMAFFGTETPKIVDIEEVYAGSLEVHISPDGTSAKQSPKPVHLWKDEATGRVFFAGMQQAHVPKLTLALVQGLSPITTTWDFQNQSTITHHIHHSHDTLNSGIPSAEPDCFGCLNGGSVCTKDDGHGVNPGNMYRTQLCNHSGTNCAITLLSGPNGGQGVCACDGSWVSTTTYSYNSCCWQNGWGWDFWWASNDNNPGSFPFCSVGYCPP